jgi:hypothetical protein
MKGKIEDVLARNEPRLMAVPGVEGVGIGGTPEAPFILVMVRQGGTQMAKKLPQEIDGYAVRVEVTGEITTL